MKNKIETVSYFDGYKNHTNGPYLLTIDDGNIEKVENHFSPAADINSKVQFIMPGLTEAHCHLFLKGDELDFARRSAYLKSDFEVKVQTAKDNLDENLKYGITYVCDAGDSYGVNRYMQDLRSDTVPGIRQAEMGIRKTGRYGSFMARQGSTPEEFKQYIEEVARSGDVLKILLTGIIDFEKGEVKGKPQFTSDELQYIVRKGKEHGLTSMVHCSGIEGLEMAIDAGVSSIEHGFFMTKELLDKMREKDITWVPTFIPVHFQYANPQYAGWSADVVEKLKAILDNHRDNLLYAGDTGVSIFVGSDAGSYGVAHGKSYIDELFLLHEAGINTADLLSWATVKPREKWNLESHCIKAGNMADLIMMDESPFDNFEVMKRKKQVYL